MLKCKACGGTDTVGCSYADYVAAPAGIARHFPGGLILVTVGARACRECGATFDSGFATCDRNGLSGSLGCNCNQAQTTCALTT